MIVDEKDGVLRLYSLARAVREVQEYLAQFADGGTWSEELIASRREAVVSETRIVTSDKAWGAIPEISERVMLIR